jgi:MSHA biogenesis protein MshP
MFPRASACVARGARQRGFSIVAALFLIVVLGVLGAALVTVATMQHSSAALDLQGVRAYQAARAGIEWGVYRVLDPEAAPAAPLPACWAPAVVAPGGGLAPFAITVECNVVAADELGKAIRVYQLKALAEFGVRGEPNYVAREIEVTVSRCQDPAAADFKC